MWYECDCMYYLFYCWKTPNVKPYRLHTSMWITSKIPEAHSVSCHFLNHMKYRGWHEKGSHTRDISTNFPKLIYCATPSDSFPGRSFKRASSSTMCTEFTNRAEHLQHRASTILVLLVGRMNYKIFSVFVVVAVACLTITDGKCNTKFCYKNVFRLIINHS